MCFLGSGGFGVPVADILVRSLHPRLHVPGASCAAHSVVKACALALKQERSVSNPHVTGFLYNPRS